MTPNDFTLRRCPTKIKIQLISQWLTRNDDSSMIKIPCSQSSDTWQTPKSKPSSASVPRHLYPRSGRWARSGQNRMLTGQRLSTLVPWLRQDQSTLHLLLVSQMLLPMVPTGSSTLLSNSIVNLEMSETSHMICIKVCIKMYQLSHWMLPLRSLTAEAETEMKLSPFTSKTAQAASQHRYHELLVASTRTLHRGLDIQVISKGTLAEVDELLSQTCRVKCIECERLHKELHKELHNVHQGSSTRIVFWRSSCAGHSTGMKQCIHVSLPKCGGEQQ